MIPLRAFDEQGEYEQAWAILQRLCRWLLGQATDFSSNERFYLVVYRHYTLDSKQARLLFAGGAWDDIRSIAIAVSRPVAEKALGYPFQPPRLDEDIFRNLTTEAI